VPVASRQCRPHRFVVTQQIARREDQIVEVKQRGGALVLMEPINRLPPGRRNAREPP